MLSNKRVYLVMFLERVQVKVNENNIWGKKYLFRINMQIR